MAQGPTRGGVAVESNGQILVADPDAGTNGQGALFRVNPISGARTLLSDFGAGANQGIEPEGVAVFQRKATAIAVPTMTEWGIIIFMLFAGLGAVYYLKRQRKALKL